MSANATAICTAIRELHLLQFRYKGLERVVAPYCLGVSHKDNQVLRAVQVRGSSSTGRFGFGKLWNVADISDLVVLDEAFIPDDPRYNPDDSAMKHIHCRVRRP